MNKNNTKERSYKGLISLSASIIAILAGFLFGFIILLISEPKNAVDGLIAILQGGFATGASGIARAIYFSVPIIMTGLSVGFAFKTGLFNIGASGQFIIGAFVAIFIGVHFTFLPPSIHWIVAIIGAGIAGALWGAIPGLLRAFYNVNEVIASIMTNYIGMYIVNMLVGKTVFNAEKNESMSVAKSAIIPKLNIGDTNINYSIIIVVIFVIVMYIILEKTTFGYEIKACGQNPEASRYAGISSKKKIVSVMAISGLLAGVGGALMYLYGAGKHIQVVDIIAPEGFDGISVALFGQSNPIGILLAGLFIGNIKMGGSSLQIFGFAPESVSIIISSIIYFGAFSLLFKNQIKNIIVKVKERGKK